MGKITGFLEIDRQDQKYVPAADRVRHFREFIIPLGEEGHGARRRAAWIAASPIATPAARSTTRSPTGTTSSITATGRGGSEPPLDQQLPRGHRPHLPRALRGGLHAQHRGRAGHHQDDRRRHRRQAPWPRAGSAPEPPATKTGKRVAIIGSGPGRLAAAQQLARAGHEVHVYEKNAQAGGLLRYGIPDFKMEKTSSSAASKQMEAEGVTFHYGVHVGRDHVRSPSSTRDYDAVLLAGGAENAARPADPGPRAAGHPLRHGLPAAAEPPHLRRAAGR